ncbi:MAG: flagellar motor switch protein FliG [Acidimicrobiales bacterium]
MSGAPALTGPQRAAVVLAQLGDERAHAVLDRLSEGDVVRLMAEVAQLSNLDADDVTKVVAAFGDEVLLEGAVRQGGIDTARRWLCERLGPGRASVVLPQLEMMMAPEPLDFLDQVDPAALVRFLADEHPQTVAVVVSKLPRASAAQVLDHFDNDLATDVLRRLATMTTVPHAVIQQVAEHLRDHLSMLGIGGTKVGGVAYVASVLTNVAHGADQAILARMERSDPELALAIRNEMFLYDDVLALDEATLQVVLRSATLREVALALKTATPEVLEKFRRNMSARAAEDLAEEINGLGPQRKSDIEAAQSSLVRLVLELTDADVISLGRADDQLIA